MLPLVQRIGNEHGANLGDFLPLSLPYSLFREVAAEEKDLHYLCSALHYPTFALVSMPYVLLG